VHESKGNLQKGTIDVKKHKDLIAPVLEKAELEHSDDFESKWEDAKRIGCAPDELREDLLNHVRSLWK